MDTKSALLAIAIGIVAIIAIYYLLPKGHTVPKLLSQSNYVTLRATYGYFHQIQADLISAAQIIFNGKPLYIPAFAVFNKGFSTSASVTSTTPKLYQYVCADNYIVYPDAVHVIANNPLNSAVNLTVYVEAKLDNGEWVKVGEINLQPGGTFNDWLVHFLNNIPDGRMIKCIGIYANVSGTPNATVTVQLADVAGVQMIKT